MHSRSKNFYLVKYMEENNLTKIKSETKIFSSTKKLFCAIAYQFHHFKFLRPSLLHREKSGIFVLKIRSLKFNIFFMKSAV